MKTFWVRLWGASLLLLAYEATTAAVNNSVQGGHGDEEALLAGVFAVFAAVVGVVVGLLRSNVIAAVVLGVVAPILVVILAVVVSPVTAQVGRPYFCSEFFRSTHHSPKICELCTPGGCGG